MNPSADQIAHDGPRCYGVYHRLFRGRATPYFKFLNEVALRFPRRRARINASTYGPSSS